MKRRDLLRHSVATGLGVALSSATTSPAGAAAAQPETVATEDIVVADFEGADWSGWTVQGTAFGAGPVRGYARLASMDIAAFHGDGVASSESGGDGPTGTITSPEFTIRRRYLAHGIGGGDYEYVTCLNLLVDGEVVRSATGRTSDTLVPGSWDVAEFAGRRARIQLVDTATGDWGHVNADHVVQTDRPEVPPANTQPLYGETWRPRAHFTARQWAMNRLEPGQRQEGWLNDLNGLVFYDGEYHLFAQRWNKCWIHAVSRDLVHWTELRPAFFEESLGTGVQSGSVVIDYGNTSGLSPDPATPPMVAFWSRNDNRSQCLSYSLDHGRTWRHHPGNPVLSMPERDPKVFWYRPGGHWVMLLYGGGRYHILTSPDLLHWTDTGNPVPDSYECPDFFELPVDAGPATKWVLVRGNGFYSVGTFDGVRFTEETAQQPADLGPHFYATQTWNNTETGDGRRVQAAWMRGGSYPAMPFNQQVTFPCELKLSARGGTLRLTRRPIAEISTLHAGTTTWSGAVKPGAPLTLTRDGGAFHLLLTLDVPAGATLTVTLFGVPVTATTQAIDGGTGPQQLTEPLRGLDIVVDRTSIEIFANDGTFSFSRCFLPNAGGITLAAAGRAVSVHPAVVHPLRSLWEK
ncbi:MAG: fructan beta-fructosidase [Actinomycetota bacterium]|nr:fructan beta-fructosidase [Actinomycetota bacterium]